MRMASSIKLSRIAVFITAGTFTLLVSGTTAMADNRNINKLTEGSIISEKMNTNIGKRFPEVTAKSLAKTKESIPDSCKGKVTLVAVAFLQKNQSQLDSWLNPFVEKFGKRDGFMFYEVPMISTGYIFMKPIIDGGMRSGIPEFKHRHVVTMYGNVEKYKNLLNIDPQLGHAFLLDREGIIRWQGKGFSTPEDIREMSDVAEKLGGGE